MFCPKYGLQYGADGGVSVLSQLSEAFPDQPKGPGLCNPCRGRGHCAKGVSHNDAGDVPKPVLAYESAAAPSRGAYLAAGDDYSKKNQNNLLPAVCSCVKVHYANFKNNFRNSKQKIHHLFYFVHFLIISY